MPPSREASTQPARRPGRPGPCDPVVVAFDRFTKVIFTEFFFDWEW
jgi:hypothetical protein